MSRKAGKNRLILMPSAAAPMPNDTDQSTNSAAYCGPCCLSCSVTSARWLHFCGATAIHLMLLPPAKRATAAAISPRPIQMAHQSSLRNKSPQGERRAMTREWAVSAISAMGGLRRDRDAVTLVPHHQAVE